jgi:hypothetical protein
MPPRPRPGASTFDILAYAKARAAPVLPAARVGLPVLSAHSLAFSLLFVCNPYRTAVAFIGGRA